MKYWLTYVLAAALTYAALAFARPALTFNPRGLALPISTANKINIPAKNVIAKPAITYQGTGEKIALINIEFHSKTQTKEKTARLIAKAKQLAGNQGADTLFYRMDYQPPGANYGELAFYKLTALAVKQGAQL